MNRTPQNRLARFLSAAFVYAAFLMGVFGGAFPAWSGLSMARQPAPHQAPPYAASHYAPRADSVVPARPNSVPHREPPVRGAEADSVLHASFSVKIRDLVSPYRVLGLFVMPGEELDIEVLFTGPNEGYRLMAEGGHIDPRDDRHWHWKAPETPGVYALRIDGPEAADQITANMFVMTPFDGTETTLDGYRIGAYEEKPLRDDPRFERPAGLFKVTEDLADTRISPHFTVGQFTSKQTTDYPRYLVLDERLVLKLERLLEALRREGIPAETFTIMSGFRTPYYNDRIGNTTVYSSHLFGRAADIFVDTDGNYRMDDLDGNGRIDNADAALLYDLIDGLVQFDWYRPFIGGLGLYGTKPHRGPFVHVDVRGYAARW